MANSDSQPVRFPASLDEDERVTAIGLYHSAHSYAMSAAVLGEVDRSVIRSDDPVRFLYTHAVELYLKSFLRMNGLPTQELRSRALGHKISALRTKAQALGLDLSAEEEKQLDLLDDGMRDRYPEIGFRTVLRIDILHSLCEKFHGEFGLPIYENEGLNRPPVRFDLIGNS